MKLADALNLIRSIHPDAGTLRVHLSCGFTPLHLKTLLAAEIWQFSRKRPEIQTGLYGDLSGSLMKAGSSGADAVVCLMEWRDLDLRLSLRSLGSWSPALFADISETASRRILEIERLAENIAAEIPIVWSPPTLPFPPISFTSPDQAGILELELRSAVAASAVRLGRTPNIRVLNLGRIDCLSAPVDRLDVKSDLLAGFPYTVPHAAALAAMLARLICEPTPKKGLITDLDDTLWKGIVGEDGVDGVAWTLDRGAHVHGMYQRFLAALADAGVLVAVASKNDPKIVDAAFSRTDLVLPKSKVFPIEANWEPKSASVARILRAWNIDADAVVFIDDSPMELAEVSAAHPGTECVQFPTDNPQAAYVLFEQLRDSFGKPRLLEEDLLRAQTLRRNSTVVLPSSFASQQDFLEQAKPELSAEFGESVLDPRALELVNKTNQFNLNGKRHTHASLSRYLHDPDGFLMVVSYKDKFGPLGKIAVVCGSRHEHAVRVDNWVMSCRAFSRRIEYWCLEELFERFGSEEVIFEFQPTERNAPLQDFLANVLGEPPSPACKLLKSDFLVRRSERYPPVSVTPNG